MATLRKPLKFERKESHGAGKGASILASFWQMPLSLKIIFALLALGLVSAIASLASFSQLPSENFLLGFWVSGALRFVPLAVLNILFPALLVYGLWSRKEWGWRVALFFYALVILQTLLSFSQIAKLAEISLQVLPPNSGVDAAQFVGMQTAILPAIFSIGIAVAAVFAFFFWKNKDYFNQ